MRILVAEDDSSFLILERMTEMTGFRPVCRRSFLTRRVSFLFF